MELFFPGHASLEPYFLTERQWRALSLPFDNLGLSPGSRLTNSVLLGNYLTSLRLNFDIGKSENNCLIHKIVVWNEFIPLTTLVVCLIWSKYSKQKILKVITAVANTYIALYARHSSKNFMYINSFCHL